MGDDRERKKPTFSELDKQRSQARSGDRERDGGRGGQGNTAQAAAQKSYRAALEKAFEAGKLAEFAKAVTRSGDEPKAKGKAEPAKPEPKPAEPVAEGTTPAPLPPPTGDPDRENRMKLLGKIRDAEGREPVSKAIDAFMARYPRLPDDYEIWTKALSHRDDEMVLMAIEAIEKMLLKEKPRRGRALVGQLRFLEETHSDPELRGKAAAARAKL